MATHSILTLSNSSATRLTPNGVHSGMDITIQNVNNTGYIYIGAESVTGENYGYRIAPGHAISFELPGTDSLYAISSLNNLKVAIIQTNLEKGS